MKSMDVGTRNLKHWVLRPSGYCIRAASFDLVASLNWGSIPCVSLQFEPVHFGVYIRVPDFWKLPSGELLTQRSLTAKQRIWKRNVTVEFTNLRCAFKLRRLGSFVEIGGPVLGSLCEGS